MQTNRLFTGAQPEAPVFTVYLFSLRGAKALKVQVQAEELTRDSAIYCPIFEGKLWRAIDRAASLALRAHSAPFGAFVAVYHDNPTPPVSSRHGAPMGRASGALDHSDYNLWRATKCRLDAGGYDTGGAYWGIRPRRVSLYAVQDGMGNVAFFDATSRADAIAQAKES